MPALQVPPAANHALASTSLPAVPPLDVLTCQLDGVSYGISLRCVQEIRSYEEPIRVANAPDFIKGFVHIRGEIVPVIDLRLSFGIPAPAYDEFTITVVLNLGGRIVGAVVDSVSDVISLQPEHIKAAPAFNSPVDTRCIAGIGLPATEPGAPMLVLLDIEKLMAGASMGLVTPALQ